MAHYKEESKNMNNKSSDRFNYLKKMTQILLPLSVFSVIFSHSSLSPLLLESYDYLANIIFNFDLKFKLFTYTTERNCIFLLCNGILVFIIQSSGLISKITPVDSAPKTSKIDDSKEKGVEKAEILEQKSSENGADFAAQVEQDLQNHEVEKWVEEDDDDDHDGDEGIDTEELKKKCEEFIKKVKLEIQGA